MLTIFKNWVIQFLPQGLAIDIAEYADELLRDFIDVERRLSSLEASKKKKESH